MRLKGKALHINIHSHQFLKDENHFQLVNLFPEKMPEIREEGFVFSIGVHPWYANDSVQGIEVLKKHLTNPQCIAVGEIGLDRVKHENLPLQQLVFEEQLKLAEEANKPVIIHCVKAYSDILFYRKKYAKTPWIIHDFNANDVITSELLQNNCYLSFGSNFMKPGTKANTFFEFLPVDKIFFETDDNENLSIEQVYEYASEIKAMDIEALRQQIIKNFNTVFG